MAFSQTTVTGTVVDTKGEPMPGAKVQVKGTDQYVITNMDGTFSVNLANPKSRLVAKYVGWNTTIKKAKEGMVIKMGKESWWNEKPSQYQWFVAANVALPERGLDGISPGLMFGRVKNFGWYVKGHFNGYASAHDCDVWLTGNTKTEYLSATGGGIIRVAGPIHVYLGVGYAKHRILDEHACGGYSDREESRYNSSARPSTKGCLNDMVGDAGLMVRVKKLFLQAGLQTEIMSGEFEYTIGNFGIGYIF